MFEISSKEVEDYGSVFYNENVYYIDVIQSENLGYEIQTLDVSEDFFNSKDVGDSVELCICKGILGKSFYFIFDELDSSDGFYGLNQWAREKNKMQSK